MEYFILLYRVTVDKKKVCYGKAGVASTNIQIDWEEIKANIFQGYKTTFPSACEIYIEPVKTTKVSYWKYLAFVNTATGAYN